VLGNLIAMPVMGFWVMPAAALSVVLMPFVLQGSALHLLGQGIAVMVAMGRVRCPGLRRSRQPQGAASRSSAARKQCHGGHCQPVHIAVRHGEQQACRAAVSLAPAMPPVALLGIALGGLWLAIWRTGWRWWGLAPLLLGAVLAWRVPRPDMLVASDALTIAVRGEDGLLHFLRKPRDGFAARDWLRRDGDTRDIQDAVGLPDLKCDGVGCVVKGRLSIAASLRPESLAEDCRRAAVLVSATATNCKGPAVVIDQKAAADGEGWHVALSSPPTAVSVRADRGERPRVPNRAE
jgi:competence protein ComEC